VNIQIGVEESKYRVTGDPPPFTGWEGVTWPNFEILGSPPYLENS